jgi:hypothetical protein
MAKAVKIAGLKKWSPEHRMNQTGRQHAATPTAVRRPGDASVGLVQCPRCGRSLARVIGQSDVMPVVYLRCDGCQTTSVAGI